MRKITVPIIFILFALRAISQPMSISVNGNVNFSNLQLNISEAGEDYSSSIENESSIYISTEFTDFWDKFRNPNKKWKIDVQKSDVDWHSDLKMEIKRTGDGSRPWYNRGKTNTEDGVNYQTISNTPTYFFRGKNETISIPISLKISGFSIIMGAQDYETSIVLTIYDD